ncbi:MAG: WG repeat-containing protein [Synechococcales cyanobacterium RM1_1_8]|nr:WG repeat-containing protein [Synechococcales cyanobacterium RM1_1_8]
MIPPQAYRSVSSFSEGLARIEVPDPNRPDRSLYGFIDRTGEVAIAPRFTWAEPFADGLASVGYYPPEDATSVQWTYIDRSGQPQLDIPKEQFGSSFSEGLAVRGIESRDPITGASIRQHGFIDKTGQWVIEPQASFVTASSFRSGFAPVGQGSDRGLINRQGRLVTPPVFSDIQDISNGYAYVNYGGVRVNYTTYYNNDVPNYDSVMRGGRWGYVKLPSSYSPDSPYSEAFPGPEPSPDPLVQPFLVVNNGAPLPPLTSSEVTRLNNEASANIQSWLALAGVGASAPPTEFTEALQSWQQQQQATNPVTAPFLGLWQGEPPASGYPHYLGVIPANEANQVCLVEYQQGQQIAFEIFPATFVLSKATIAQGNLRSPRLRSVQSVSTRYPFENGSGGTTKVLSLLQATDNNRVRSFSLTDPSGLYDSFSPRMRRELTQSLSALGCTPENIRDRT